MADEQRRLYRSKTNRVFAGVCGGVAEYLNVDPTVVRILWIFLTILGGSGFILYIVSLFVIPEDPRPIQVGGSPATQQFTGAGLVGAIFLVVGIGLLLDNLDVIHFHHWWDFSWDFVFPAILILVGFFIIFRRGSKQTIPQPSEAPESSTSSGTAQPPTPPPAPQPTQGKTLHRSVSDRKIFGICGGLAEYLGMDSTIVRLLYAVFTLMSVGAGIVLYFLMYLLIPEDHPQATKSA